MKIRSAPSITRVHTLHRIRSVTNYITRLSKRGEPTDDIAIADYLIDTLLSKPTTDKLRDQIGRRARDHLETARYLGFLYRVKVARNFSHFPTPYGKELTLYSLQEECPKDTLEEAIFTDRICRFKMANTSYLQTRGPNKDHRSRTCLCMLGALVKADNKHDLDVFQLGYLASEKKLDPALDGKRFDSIYNQIVAKNFNSYRRKLTSKDKKNIIRDTKPFVDWLSQVGLVEKADEYVVKVTERGRKVFQLYVEMVPIWWVDLPLEPRLAAATILCLNYLNAKGFRSKEITKKLMDFSYKIGFFTYKVQDIIREMNLDLGQFYDFSLYYDVPKEEWDLVTEVVLSFLRSVGIHIKAKDVFDITEWQFEQKLERAFKSEALSVSKAYSKRLGVKTKVSTYAITLQFQSPYESEVYLLLKTIIEAGEKGLKVEKYQGQLSDNFADDKRLEKVAKTNPDLLLVNNIYNLIDCKSESEWGGTLRYSKKTISEMQLYNDYSKEIEKRKIKEKAVSVFMYEGTIDSKNREELEKIVSAYSHVLIVTRRALQEGLAQTVYRKKFRQILASCKGGLIIDI